MNAEQFRRYKSGGKYFALEKFALIKPPTLTTCHRENWVYSIPKGNPVLSCSMDQFWCRSRDRTLAPFSASGDTTIVFLKN